jgi:hypothetical protein
MPAELGLQDSLHWAGLSAAASAAAASAGVRIAPAAGVLVAGCALPRVDAFAN